MKFSFSERTVVLVAEGSVTSFPAQQKTISVFIPVHYYCPDMCIASWRSMHCPDEARRTIVVPVGDNTHMADITVYVAVVTGVFTVIGATIPQAAAVIQSSRRAQAEERERYGSAKRDACLDLLRSVGQLRTQVANNHDYRGNEMAPRLALVREHAANTKVYAAKVAFLVPQPLADLAAKLDMAAASLATSAENPARPPDFTELDERVAAFTAEARGTSPD
jgi:hypothetical protein